MKGKILFISLIGIIATLMAFNFESLFATPENVYAAPTVSATPSCAQPTAEMAAGCAKMEAAILASTVRVDIYRWKDEDGGKGEYISGGSSHATIKDGRYLVTHNHFGELFNGLRDQEIPGEFVRISLHKTNGELIISNLPLTKVTLIFEDSETLVLEFKGYGNLGFFEAMGLPSAPFANWNQLTLQPGTEVAQIDWDGHTSHVNWTTIESIMIEDGTPQITLTSYVEQGASGGGIFLNGLHIANNWMRATEEGQVSDQVYGQYSVAALNSTQMMTPTPNAEVTNEVENDTSGQNNADLDQSLPSVEELSEMSADGEMRID